MEEKRKGRNIVNKKKDHDFKKLPFVNRIVKNQL